ncbi:MAG: GNAT family N-acetyltransferase [Acidimicrobiales bacterium]|jgi:GNAT superfamily N-acetyltransferase
MEAVRTAIGADTGHLLEMAEDLSGAVAAQRGGTLLLPPSDHGAGPAGRDRLDDLLADESALVLVGTLDDVVAGFCVCHVEDLGPSGPRGVLDACYVEPGARGVGLGRLLLDSSVSWLEAHGCRGVDGIALPGDRGAKNFYESAGFKARMLTMHREID